MNIVYISSIVPRYGTGGWIVAKRHFERFLKSGHEISIICPDNYKDEISDPENYKIITFPFRKIFWPPVRSIFPFTHRIRHFQWYSEIQVKIKQYNPELVITTVPDYFSLFAVFVAKKLKIPLVSLIHDDWEYSSNNKKSKVIAKKNQKTILRNSSLILTVSDNMTSNYKDLTESKVKTLYPIPEKIDEYSTWKKINSSTPVIAHAGSFYLHHLPYFLVISRCLEKVNGKLLIIANDDNEALIALKRQCSNIVSKGFFDKNIDVINYISKHASSILICYPKAEKDNLWPKFSFPSRLLEYSQLGIPLLIIAPYETSLSDWAIQNKWPSYTSDCDNKLIFDFIESIMDKEKWYSLANQTRSIASKQFDPDVIHNKFENELLKLL